MIADTPRLRRFEAEYQRNAYRQVSYADALACYAMLLGEARLLNPDFGTDWEEDLAADLAVARAINGLPPV
jgi:hypothetical protein